MNEWEQVIERTKAFAIRLWTSPMTFNEIKVLVLDDEGRSIHKGDKVMICGDDGTPVEVVSEVVKANPEHDGINEGVDFAVEGRYPDGQRVNICLYWISNGVFRTENVDLLR